MSAMPTRDKVRSFASGAVRRDVGPRALLAGKRSDPVLITLVWQQQRLSLCSGLRSGLHP